MIESDAVRDWEGVEQPAEQWQPDQEYQDWGPRGEPLVYTGQLLPGAVNIATEWTTPQAGMTHFLVNGAIRRNEWQPKGVRLGIGVSYPLEPLPEPQPQPQPVPIEVESCTLQPTAVLPGESAMLTVRLKAPAPEPVSFTLLTDPQKVAAPSGLVVEAGQIQRSEQIRALLGASGSVTLRIARLGWFDDVILTIRQPPTPTPDLHNVRDFGAKGDGTTRDDPAIQQAILAAQPGHVVYFPAGIYHLADSVKVYKNGGIRFEGDGEQSIILQRGGVGFQLGTGGQPYENLSVRGLLFRGLIGRTGRDGNTGHAIQIYGPKLTVVEDCRFEWPGCAVFNAGAIGTTYGTVLRRLKVRGWGGVAAFCNGGELIVDCELIQEDPDERGEKTSHGIYIHSGCDNVTVERVLIEKARKYGMQLYGQDVGTTIANVTLRDVTMRSCANGLTLQQSAPDRARIRNLLVERLICEDIYAGPALSIKQGDSATFRDIRLACRPGNVDSTGMQLGLYAPYEPSFYMSDMTFERPVITDCGRGIWAMLSFGGKFSNLKVLQPVFERCRSEVVLQDWNGVPVTGLEIIR